MSGLIVLKPFQVTPESMDSSVPEDDYPAYSAGTTYAEDQRVLYLHNIYQSLQAGNTGKTPDTEPRQPLARLRQITHHADKSQSVDVVRDSARSSCFVCRASEYGWDIVCKNKDDRP